MCDDDVQERPSVESQQRGDTAKCSMIKKTLVPAMAISEPDRCKTVWSHPWATILSNNGATNKAPTMSLGRNVKSLQCGTRQKCCAGKARKAKTAIPTPAIVNAPDIQTSCSRNTPASERRLQTTTRRSAQLYQTSVAETQADAAICETTATGSAINKASAIFAS